MLKERLKNKNYGHEFEFRSSLGQSFFSQLLMSRSELRLLFHLLNLSLTIRIYDVFHLFHSHLDTLNGCITYVPAPSWLDSSVGIVLHLSLAGEWFRIPYKPEFFLCFLFATA